ncbi:hypothetical protein ACFLQU_04705 [Verrucomicrobiota bacterium]
MRITGARFIRATGKLTKDIAMDNGRALMPADIDPAYAARPLKLIKSCLPDEDGVRRIRCTFLQLETDEGITGTSTQIGLDQVKTIREQLLPYMVGRDPLAIEENWDVWCPICSVGHGPDGMDTNIEVVRALRETVGDRIDTRRDLE